MMGLMFRPIPPPLAFVLNRFSFIGDPLNNSQTVSGQPAAQLPVRCIIPQHSISYLKLWTGYYCRWNPRMRPQDSVALRHRSTQLLAIKGQLRQKVEALRKELETKRKSNLSRSSDMDEGNGETGNREHAYSAMGMGGKFPYCSLHERNRKYLLILPGENYFNRELNSFPSLEFQAIVARRALPNFMPMEVAKLDQAPKIMPSILKALPYISRIISNIINHH